MSLDVDAKKGLDKAEDVIDEAGKIKICGDQTLAEVAKGDAISDSCRDALESTLPQPQTSFESTLVVLGDVRDEAGERVIYVIGADQAGDALFTDLSAEVEVDIAVDGKTRVLETGEFSFELPSSGDLLSLSIVDDYSASMRDEDLEVVSEIETDLFTYLPPIYESEVTLFSTTASVKQAYTEDSDALLAAVATDDEYERESTALYDGMGLGLTNLVKRERPLKVMLVSTDGAENASTLYEESELITTIDDEKVVVIMLGALLADVDSLKRLAGDRGIYVYARGYGRLKSAVAGLIESLSHVAAVHLPQEVADADSVTLKIDGQTLTVR